jgi:hypothetical protein
MVTRRSIDRQIYISYWYMHLYMHICNFAMVYVISPGIKYLLV